MTLLCRMLLYAIFMNIFNFNTGRARKQFHICKLRENPISVFSKPEKNELSYEKQADSVVRLRHILSVSLYSYTREGRMAYACYDFYCQRFTQKDR
jgi:hypothetical protein